MEPGTVILHVLPLALGAAVSPALLGASLEILAAFTKRGIRMLLLYLLGATVVLVAAIAIASVLPQRAGPGSTAVADAVDLVLAALLLALAAVLVFRHPRSGSGATGTRLLGSKWAGLGVVGLGLFMMITNLSTLVLVLAGTHEVNSALHGSPWRLLGYLVLAIGALVPILVPLAWIAIAGATGMRQLERLNAVLTRHGRVIGIVVCVLTAAYLALRGFGIL